MIDEPVDWDAVRRFMRYRFPEVPPTAGTPEWAALDDTDPSKAGALLIAGSRWVLETQLAQRRNRIVALKDATVAVSTELPWKSIAKVQRDRDDFYRAHPDLKRRRSA